ncbi:hypothetical protein DWW58_07150 [Olsenella sp. AF16-14LB]|nr:hypothetical protein DXD59_02635 [Olsenella sp. TM06-36]RGS50443.1 hypothetical protein DWX86_08795 [Olsenella sp. AF21-51]RGU50558.1 hypothetical protein DWW58_07150 [Olsenella sp. AF16-14LB]RGU82015.1 hypothetical protein DWW44_07125 [Olsenella sp. AF15-43LB]RHB57493.1 hypothetical protein DW878_01355 [Olsenella sp. AM39-30AC]RHD76042.1 hypothetical protein DW781_02140 [Olsenella sp. AM30-3LB]RHJ98399.1 hypothetical protein DW090_05855 [Olsenella sp. AM05-17]
MKVAVGQSVGVGVGRWGPAAVVRRGHGGKHLSALVSVLFRFLRVASALPQVIIGAVLRYR